MDPAVRRTGQRPARAQVELGVLREHLPLEAAQERARLDSELGERGLRAAVGGESVDLPAGAVEREHELGTELLAVRVLGHEPLELGDQHVVASQGEVSLDSLLENGEPEVGETRATRAGRTAP